MPRGCCDEEGAPLETFKNGEKSLGGNQSFGIPYTLNFEQNQGPRGVAPRCVKVRVRLFEQGSRGKHLETLGDLDFDFQC